MRDELARRLGRVVTDAMWEWLERWGWIGDAPAHDDPVGYLADRVREADQALRSGREPDDSLGGSAIIARIDTLSTVYAAWANQDSDVERYRHQHLVDQSSPEYLAAVRDRCTPPGYALLDPTQVPAWVLAHAEPLAEVEALVAATTSATGRKVIDLRFIDVTADDDPPPGTPAAGIERRQTVARLGILGDLAQLADKLANRYRWNPAEATNFVLTGTVPNVDVYVGSIDRGGATTATTRITMVLDPFLTPKQVANIYHRLKLRLAPDTGMRSQGDRRYRLARFVAPHVTITWERPQDRVGPGRRPAAPYGHPLLTIRPTDGRTWTSLMHAWNAAQAVDAEPGGKQPSRCDHPANFARDAQAALRQILFPGWRRDLTPPPPRAQTTRRRRAPS